jgi:hypothetical protein
MSDESNRLYAISPAGLAQDVCIQVWDAVEAQSEALGRPVKLRNVDENSPLFEAVCTITVYAQIGTIDLSHEDLNLVVKTVFCPPDPHSGLRSSEQWEREGEPRTPLETVIYSALARFRVEHGAKVPVAWLAALGSCSVKRLRNLGAEGRIKIEEGNISASVATKWLQNRSVPGFEPRFALSAAAARLGKSDSYVRKLARSDGDFDERWSTVSKAWVERRLAINGSAQSEP